MTDSILEQSARRLVRDMVGDFVPIAAELCRFVAGRPVRLPESGKRSEELLADIGILNRRNGLVSLNVKIVGGQHVRWDW